MIDQCTDARCNIS